MSVKRFVAPDMRRALDLVRAEMGPEAIILSSQRTAKGVEIITSLDTDLPTRGADTRREFGQKFDPDFDSPMASDAAWQSQRGMEQAATHLKLESAERGRPIKGSERRPMGESLALKIEQARERMLAEKRQPQASARAKPRASREREAIAQAAATSIDEAAFGSWQPDDYVPSQGGASHWGVDTEFGPAGQNQPVPSQLDQQMAGLAEQLKSRGVDQRSFASDERLSELQNQIADMRLMLEQQMWRMRDGQAGATAATSLAQETVARHLQQLGLPADMVNQLAVTAKSGKHLSTAWREALALLAHKIAAPAQDVVNAGGVFALVGPTGVGKTTTIAKLASRYVLEHGLGKVALVTTDTYRVGAHDQLRALGRILNVPVRVADKEHNLATVVASLRDYPLVLIDTAGFRQGDPLLKEQETMLSECPTLKRILVLASNSQQQNLKASTHAYRGGVMGCIFTKLDETSSLGEALSVAIAQKLPVLYSTDGQGIPDDIAVASPHNLVAKAVSIMKLSGEQRALEASAL